MSLWADLKRAPARLSPAARYTVFNGFVYMALGLLFVVWPGAVQTLFLEPDFVGQEATLFRVIGLTLMVIGWLYVFGGRTGGRQVVAASIVDRLTFVPLILVVVALAGVFPHVFLFFAVADPALGLIAWWLLNKEHD